LLVDPERFGWLVPIIILGVPLVLGLVPGLAVFAAWRLSRPGWSRIVALTGCWVLFEFVRGFALTGFPWGLIGYSFGVTGALAQGASVVGVYGLSVLAVVGPAALGLGLLRLVLGPVRLTSFLLVGAVLLGVPAAWGAWRLSANPTMETEVTVGLIQPNVPQDIRFDPVHAQQNVLRLLQLTNQALDQGADVVIWPETAIPFGLDGYPGLRQALGDILPDGARLITGSHRIDRSGEDPLYFNGLYVLDDDSGTLATYDKAHLVPFGEYMPLRDVLPLDSIAAGPTDMTAGPGPRTLHADGIPAFSPLICYEVIFPGAAIDPDDPPQWLLTVTNDAWFGLTAGPHQHFAMARFRAIEQGLPLVRVANTGISGVVDPVGRVLSTLSLGDQAQSVRGLPRSLSTPPYFARLGHLPALSLATLLLLGAILWPGFVVEEEKSLKGSRDER